jgi:flagellar biosynthesis/type III secretory pathway chaperone
MSDTLAALHRELETFLELLREESSALAAGDAERLGGLTSRRETASRNLLALWADLADRLGLPADSALAALRDRASGGKPPGEDWLTLERLAAEAAQLNRVNGRLLEEQMRRTQIAMQVLQNAAASHGLYDAGGHVTEFFNINRKIDSA